MTYVRDLLLWMVVGYIIAAIHMWDGAIVYWLAGVPMP